MFNKKLKEEIAKLSVLLDNLSLNLSIIKEEQKKLSDRIAQIERKVF